MFPYIPLLYTPVYAQCCAVLCLVLCTIVDPAPQGTLDFLLFFINTFMISQTFYHPDTSTFNPSLSFTKLCQLNHRTLWWDVVSLRSPRTRNSKSSKRKSTILSQIIFCHARRFKSPAVSTEMAIRNLP